MRCNDRLGFYKLYGEIYALATAFLRGFCAIPTRKGLRYSNANTSALFSMFINTAFQWSIALTIYPLELLNISGIEYFVLAGFFAPGVARVFRDMSFMRLGVSISYPLVSTNTFFSIILAVVFLGEEVTTFLALGAMMIIVGINVLAWQGGARAKWRKRDLAIPLIAALLFACSTNLRKIGLREIDYPIIGAAITSTVSLMVLLFSALLDKMRSGSWPLELPRESVKFFAIAGIGSSVAYLLYFMALSASHIVKIQPISSTNPMFAMLFSYFFLREEERITSKIVLGSLLIISGITLIFL